MPCQVCGDETRRLPGSHRVLLARTLVLAFHSLHTRSLRPPPPSLSKTPNLRFRRFVSSCPPDDFAPVVAARSRSRGIGGLLGWWTWTPGRGSATPRSRRGCRGRAGRISFIFVAPLLRSIFVVTGPMILRVRAAVFLLAIHPLHFAPFRLVTRQG
ncbi:hypothetical protein EJB05_49432, partial [Eragrostis curvula]